MTNMKTSIKEYGFREKPGHAVLDIFDGRPMDTNNNDINGRLMDTNNTDINGRPMDTNNTDINDRPMDTNNKDINGALEEHTVHIAVNYIPPFFITMREDYYIYKTFYHYNIAEIPIKLGRGDKSVYPLLEKAIDEVKSSSNSIVPLRILFNAPQPHWKRPPNNGNLNNGIVRVRVEAESLLKKLFSNFVDLTVVVTGLISRVTFRSGRKHSICLKFPVINDGTTKDKTLRLPAGLFGLFQLDGLFTVTLEWVAPRFAFDGMDKKLLSRFRITEDLKIFNDEEAFFCYSFLLVEVSPVFSAMLSNNTLESQTMEIGMTDTDGKVIEAFINFVHHRDLSSACEDSEICIGLLLLADKYCITMLENATKNIICRRPLEWLSTAGALDLLLFCNFSPNSQNLEDIALAALKSRKGELRNLKKFHDMVTNWPKMANQLVE